MFLPCPLEPARAADFDLSKWFARIVFPCYFLNPFYAMFEDLIFPSNIPSIPISLLSSRRLCFKLLLVHEFLGFAYFHSEKGLPYIMLSY